MGKASSSVYCSSNTRLPVALSPPPSAATNNNASLSPLAGASSIGPPSSSSASSNSKKQPGSRRTLSCLPCRQHKLKCDRHVPCRSCSRYRRADQCLQNPAPSSVLNGRSPAQPPQPQAAVAATSFRGSSRDTSVGDHLSSQAPLWSSSTASRTNNTTPPTHVAASHDSPDSAPPIVEEPISSTNGQSLSPQDTGQQDTEQSTPLWPARLLSTSISDTSLLPPLSAPYLAPVDQKNASGHTDVSMFWKSQLLSVLPRRTQCDLLVSYYTDHMDWVYHPVHLPSFYKAYNEFWECDIIDIDIAWLSLLFSIISCGALYAPLNEAESVGLDKSKLRNLAHVWHSASRQALHASGFEAKPDLTHLQTFLVTQLYWLATRTVETMNSCLGQTIRNAQALGLDKDTPGANPLDTEIRRRVWWELFNCDTFQSICLSRAPLIHTSGLKVPFPLNCNDVDVTETSVRSHPMDEPTDISATVLRAKIFLVFRKLFADDPEQLSYDYVQSIDAELEEEISNLPWYFQLESCQKLLPRRDSIVWQYHIIHSCICIQRIRMHRPFLQQQIGESWNVCAKATREVLSVYKVLRTPDIERLRRSHKFYVQAYQIFSAAVAQAAFLLVERSFPVETIRNDIEMVISDLSLGGLGDVGVSTMADGKKILMTMLDMSDRRRRREPLEPESLVPEISAVFGGEQTARKYLTRCDIGYVLNRDSTAAPDRQDRGSVRPIDDNGAATIDTQSQFIYPTQAQEVNDLSEFFYSYYSTQADTGLPFGIMDTDQWGSFLSGATFTL